MGVEIKLTDKEFPVSPALIEFLHHHITGRPQDVSWYDQLSETLVPVKVEPPMSLRHDPWFQQTSNICR